jgi:hypothetical protein
MIFFIHNQGGMQCKKQSTYQNPNFYHSISRLQVNLKKHKL